MRQVLVCCSNVFVFMMSSWRFISCSWGWYEWNTQATGLPRSQKTAEILKSAMKQHVNTQTQASLHVTGNQDAAQLKSVFETIWIPHALALLL
jgi:hypothetical protein